MLKDDSKAPRKLNATMAPVSPTISISVHAEDYLKVTFSTHGDRDDHPTENRPEGRRSSGNQLSITTLITPHQLREYSEEYYSGLDTFMENVGDRQDVSDFDALSRAMDMLHEHGSTMIGDLFDYEDVGRIETFLVEAIPKWEQSVLSGKRVPPRVEITTPFEYSLPFELMPLFDISTPSPIRDSKDLGRVASRFLGFSAIVYRIFPRFPPKISDMLERDPRLTIRFFQHAGLPGATTERKFFDKFHERIDLQGPWPDQPFGDEDLFANKLAAQLWVATTSPMGGASQRLDHVHHFACHCDTEPTNSSDYSLLLSHKDGRKWEQPITARKLQARFTKYSKMIPRLRPKESYPLVFLNACGTSKTIPTALTSFPKLFLRTYRGVIGTETPIPDDFAAAFSGKFYARFVRGFPLGEALHRARWDFLKRSSNPLGILYTAYANPDLRVIEDPLGADT